MSFSTLLATENHGQPQRSPGLCGDSPVSSRDGPGEFRSELQHGVRGTGDEDTALRRHQPPGEGLVEFAVASRGEKPEGDYRSDLGGDEWKWRSIFEGAGAVAEDCPGAGN